MMKQKVYTLLALLLATITMMAQESHYAPLEQQLRQAPVQEKIYLHTDNNCYYKGDTIWYKAYVVRADSLTYSDMSRITYVELLSPDGMLVERQQIISWANGYSCGSFALQDSIYSGYYELRAYTRWMLNFCVTQHDYNYKDRVHFFTRDMANDFYREYGTIYSRVIPVYERPEEEGDYGGKYIVSRPMMRLEKEKKSEFTVRFYPEGGHLVEGQHCRVAFEAFDEEGQQVDVEGKIDGMTIRSEHEGRGLFEVDVPRDRRLKAVFNYKGKDYQFALPKAEERGLALTVSDDGTHIDASLALQGMQQQDCAVAVLCRGRLYAFQVLTFDASGRASVTIDKAQLPTGVCDLMVIDHDYQPMADRLFFVNHHDYSEGTITVSGVKDEYAPLEQATITLQAPADTRHLSVAIRDGATDDPSYDTGSMLTDLLLSSELQGFIPHPDYYFQADDETHRRHLDLLLMVQGWRRYDYHDLTSTQLRYAPERTMTIDGDVYAYTGTEFFEREINDINQKVNEIKATLGKVSTFDEGEDEEDIARQDGEETEGEGDTEAEPVEQDYAPADNSNSGDTGGGLFRSRHLKHEVTLKGELVLGTDVAEVEMQTSQGGHFTFNVPAFYGDAVLFLMAFDSKWSPEKQQKYQTKDWRNEKAIPNYYVKRNLFFPIFPKKYNYYQCHEPEGEYDHVMDSESLTPESERISKMDRTLQAVNVKSRRRRGRRMADYSKPALVMDTHEIYNLGIDYGMIPAYYEFVQLPQVIARLLYGTHHEYLDFVMANGLDDTRKGGQHGDQWYETNAMLCRQDNVYIYSDLEPRNPDKYHVHTDGSDGSYDILALFTTMPDEGKRPTYRDRRIILHGFHEPQQFYHRDYSHQPLPAEVKDYRRTLYWNPNAVLDADGRFTATFYNNNKPTRIRVSSVGLTSQGQPVTTPRQ